MQVESWKPVEGYETLYEVSDLGRVRSHHSSTRRRGEAPHVLAAGNTRGYRTVVLAKGRRHRSFLVHQLVARAFLGQAPRTLVRPTVNHVDYDKANNSAANLEWVSHADNNRHSARVIPRLRGEANRSKLTEEAVRRIREARLFGAIFADLSKIHGVSLQTCSAIYKGQKWAHVQ